MFKCMQNGVYLDSCILLGTGSSYSAAEDDQVYLEEYIESLHGESSSQIANGIVPQNIPPERSSELIIEVQVGTL